ncbi:protein of unknown function [Georgfuchsia toluolica]|uniref:Uncharacterized protein n=1 Tax=Georgfuchsia toluolica TaxID=424218 RepID=A0A916J6Q4_9PROT|nr:protein of unknown function [Georgfuchsia toluolica]
MPLGTIHLSAMSFHLLSYVIRQHPAMNGPLGVLSMEIIWKCQKLYVGAPKYWRCYTDTEKNNPIAVHAIRLR